MANISQREARRLRRRVEELESRERARRATWGQEWFGGVVVASCKWEPSDVVPVAIRTARLLTHAVVVKADDAGNVRFVALPHYKDAA
jgi:hypothetical protein